MTGSPSSSSKADDAWIVWAKLGRPHGLKGELRILLNNPDSEHLGEVSEVRIVSGERTVATRLVALRGADGARIARFDGVGDRDAAEALKGAEVLVPRDIFPPLDEGEFYAFELEGLSAVDADGRRVGTVETLTSFGAGEILVVRTGADVEFLPFAEPWVGAIDLDAGTVVVDLDGFRA